MESFFPSEIAEGPENSISGLGSVAIHLLLLILIAIVPWTRGSEGVGETYEVMISEKGYLWRNQKYRSLTAIAREITGANWSGPRFFGVMSSNHDQQR